MTYKILGTKEQIGDKISIHRLQIPRKPLDFPDIPSEAHVVGEYNQGFQIMYIYCPDLTSMQAVYNQYKMGDALELRWYWSYNAKEFIFA